MPHGTALHRWKDASRSPVTRHRTDVARSEEGVRHLETHLLLCPAQRTLMAFAGGSLLTSSEKAGQERQKPAPPKALPTVFTTYECHEKRRTFPKSCFCFLVAPVSRSRFVARGAPFFTRCHFFLFVLLCRVAEGVGDGLRVDDSAHFPHHRARRRGGFFSLLLLFSCFFWAIHAYLGSFPL